MDSAILFKDLQNCTYSANGHWFIPHILNICTVSFIVFSVNVQFHYAFPENSPNILETFFLDSMVMTLKGSYFKKSSKGKLLNLKPTKKIYLILL